MTRKVGRKTKGEQDHKTKVRVERVNRMAKFPQIRHDFLSLAKLILGGGHAFSESDRPTLTKSRVT